MAFPKGERAAFTLVGNNGRPTRYLYPENALASAVKRIATGWWWQARLFDRRRTGRQWGKMIYIISRIGRGIAVRKTGHGKAR